MEFFVDTADLNAIRAVAEYYPIDGFTTNPKILASQGEKAKEQMAQYREFAGEKNVKVFFQVTGDTAEEMFREAKALQDYFGEHFIVKIPAVKEGYKALRLCTEAGIPVLMTVVHSVMQAVMAARGGAIYVAPYVNKLDDMGADGVNCVANMVAAFEYGGYDCKVLGAGFRTVDQIQRLATVGCHGVTCRAEMFDQIIAHPATDASMAGFDSIWRETYGEKQVSDLLPE